MATHFSILAWEIPWIEEPGRLCPWGHNDSDTIQRLSTILEYLFNKHLLCTYYVFQASQVPLDKVPTCKYETLKRLGFDPWVGKIPWRGNGSPLQYSGLENPMDRGARRATQSMGTSQTRQMQLSTCYVPGTPVLSQLYSAWCTMGTRHISCS